MFDYLGNFIQSSQGAASKLFALTDMFARANSTTLGERYSESTYAVSSYAAVNSPTLGVELLSNPGLEAPYVGGVATGWTAYGSGTASEENVIVHGGSSSQKLVRVATSDRVVAAFSTTAGKWYSATAWVYEASGVITLNGGTSSSNNTLFSLPVAPGGAWVQVAATFRATTATSYIGMWCGGAAGSTGYLDDVSVKEIDFPSTLAVTQTAVTKFSVHCSTTSAYGEFIGMALRFDAARQNGIIVYVSPGASKLVVDKCVSGTWSNVYSGAVVVSNTRVLRVDQDGTTIKVYYAGSLVTMQVIAITPTIDNYCGLFNGGSLGKHSMFAVTPYGASPALTLYVSPAGDDAYPGSADLPKLTIASANAKAAAMDAVAEVYIGAGTYSELCTVPGTRNNLTYSGAGDTSIIDGSGVRSGLVATAATQNLVIKNIKLSNCADYGIRLTNIVNPTVMNCTIDGATVGIAFDSCTGAVQAVDCAVSGCIQQGMRSKGVPNTQFVRCYVHTPGDPGCYAFESEGVGTDDNVYTDCWAIGAFPSHFISKLTRRCQYYRCVAANGATFGFYQKGSTDTLVDHCVAYACGGGVYAYDNAGVAPETTGLQIKSTMIANNIAEGYEITATGDGGADFDFNNVYGNPLAGKWVGSSYATLALWQAASGQDANSVALNPGYTDTTYPSGFRLPAGSALLTAGVGGSAIGIDT